jgi:nicotinate (nicotinamide) nucleotide adenylyltransferase
LIGNLFSFLVAFIFISTFAVARPLRIGVYSGSFDPPHSGHEELLETARIKMNLDILIVIPVLANGEKPNATIYQHRKQMTKIAFKNKPWIQLPDAEMEAAFAKARVAGVINLLKNKSKDNRIFQIMGADAFENFRKLPDHVKPKDIEIVVGSRDNFVDLFSMAPPENTHFIQTTGSRSSTKARNIILDGLVPDFVHPDVLKYSKEKNLYSLSPFVFPLKETEKIINKIQELVADEFGIKNVYLGGGSSRAVLDFALMGKPPAMRDLDLFMTMGRQVDKSDLEKLGRKIEQAGLGKVQWTELQPRVRSNPQLPMPEKFNYITGYGFSVKIPGSDTDLDLSIYHTESDLAKNGIFNIDQVLLPLTVPLEAYTKKIRSMTIPKLISDGLLIDPNDGYLAWIAEKKPTVVNWDSIAIDTGANMIRAVRGFYKNANPGLSDEFRQKAKELVLAYPPKDKRRLIRNIIKLLEDKTAVAQLKDLSDIGLIERWSPALAKKIQIFDSIALKSLFESSTPVIPAKVSEVGLGRLLSLTDMLSPNDREEIFEDINLLEPQAVESKKNSLRCLAVY